MLRVTVWSKTNPEIVETFVVDTNVSMDNLMAILKEVTPYQVSVMQGNNENPLSVIDAINYTSKIKLYKTEKVEDVKEFDVTLRDAINALQLGADNIIKTENGNYHIIFDNSKTKKTLLSE